MNINLGDKRKMKNRYCVFIHVYNGYTDKLYGLGNTITPEDPNDFELLVHKALLHLKNAATYRILKWAQKTKLKDKVVKHGLCNDFQRLVRDQLEAGAARGDDPIRVFIPAGVWEATPQSQPIAARVQTTRKPKQ